LGYSKEEFHDNHFLDFIHPEDIESTKREFDNLKKGFPISSFVNRFRKKNKGYVALLWNVMPDLASEKIFAIGVDITKEKEIEFKLVRQQEMLVQMSKLGKIGAWEYVIDSERVYLSPMVKQIFGVHIDYIPDIQKFTNFFKNNSRPLLLNSFQDCIASGESWHLELEIITGNGKSKWVEVTGESEFVDGRCERMFGSIQDINEKKLASENLEDEIKLSRTIAKTQSLFISETDSSKAFDSLLNDILKLTDSEYGFIGEILYKEGDIPFLKTHAITNISWDEETRKFYEENAPGGLEFHNLNSLFGVALTTLEPVISNSPDTDPRKAGRPPGHPPMRSFLGIPVSRNKKGIAMIGVANRPGGYDKELVDWLAPLLGTLSQIVENSREVRAREIAQKELIKAKEAAEAATKAKSEFLASMSHEIRTPMNGVIGMLNLLNHSELTGEQSKFAEVAQNSAESLLILINDILDFSKIEADKLNLEKNPFHLGKLFQDFSKSIVANIKNKPLELIFESIDLDKYIVLGDSGRILQILNNLVGNAIKFTEEGEIFVKSKIEENSERVKFTCSIIDSGIGIPEEKIPFLFDSFTQVDTSTTRKFGGTGLGLAISKKLCELMKGNISVESKLGKGSTFTFEIYLDIEKIITIPKIKGTKVFLVTFNESLKNILSSQIKSLGAIVRSFSSFEDLKEELEKSDKINFLLIDTNPENFDKLNNDQELKKIILKKVDKLNLIINIKSNKNIYKLEKLKVNNYFHKPLTFEDIKGILEISDTEEIKSSSKPQSKIQDGLRKDFRILMAEDNYTNQLVLKGILRKLGLKADFVSNGQEVINILNQASEDPPYELILMDCQMPEMDGFEATRQIGSGKAGENYKKIPIIALTANAMLGDRERCIEAGMDDYMTKPVKIPDLKITLKKWMK
ncbi:MAG: response regulator, partial [Leptospiraceae bacterium]|nr:response regulator [Leptospiraceae bacterium]